MRTNETGRSSRLAGLVGLLVLLVVTVWTVIDLQPQAPAGVQAPETAFAAERAQRHIEAIAQEPRPMGSDAHARAQDYLVGELEALGVQVEVHEAVGTWPLSLDRSTPVGRVENIVGVIEGQDPTGRIVLAAHYDSTPTSPGANDDGAGVAAVLEVTRALLAQDASPRNDVVVLLTDGEEMGLLGAEAFVDSHPLGDGDGIVLNHEARGASGAAVMFRASQGSADLIRLLATAVPSPVADSATSELFELLPNDTDFIAFVGGGFAALDFAYSGGSAYYHSALDLPANVSLRSLQHMGDNTLAMASELAARDLRDLDTSEGDALVYANAPPGLLLVAPTWSMLVLGLVGLGAAIVAVVAARRRGLVTVPTVLLGAGSAVLLLAAGVGAAWGYWRAIVAVRPGFDALLTGTPYRPLAFQVAVLALLGGLALVWYLLLRRRVGDRALWLGAVLLVAVLGLLVAATSPGSSVAFVVPATSVALAAVAGVGTRDRGAWRMVALTAGLVPVGVLLVPAAWIVFEVGMPMSPFLVAPFAVLAFLLALPLVEALWPRRRAGLAVALVTLVIVATSALGLVRNPLDDSQPVPVQLTYTLDADTGQATWAAPLWSGRDARSQEWLGQYVGEEAVDPTPGSRPGQRAHVGPAPAVDAPAPELTVLSDEADGEHRTIDLELTSVRGATGLGLLVDVDPVRAAEIVVEGRRLLPADATGDAVGLRFHAVPASGTIEVRLVLRDDGDGPVTVQVADVDSQPQHLTAIPGYTEPPPELYLLHSSLSVVRSYDL